MPKYFVWDNNRKRLAPSKPFSMDVRVSLGTPIDETSTVIKYTDPDRVTHYIHIIPSMMELSRCAIWIGYPAGATNPDDRHRFSGEFWLAVTRKLLKAKKNGATTNT